MDGVGCFGWTTCKPFAISEHTYVKEGGYKFQDPAFFNHLFKTGIDDDFVKLFEKFKFSKNYTDFTKHTDDGVDNERHLGEHYCCLINSLIRLGCDRAVLENARTCITGLDVPKSALKAFCNIAKIKILKQTKV